MAEQDVNLKLNVDAGNATKSLTDLKNEFRALQQAMSAAGKAGDTELFKKLQAQAGQLKNDMKDAKGAMNALDPGELLKGYVKLGQGAIGAFAGITGAMSLFGAESKTIQEIEKKSAVLIQTMIGLEQVRQIFIDEGGKKEIANLIATTALQYKKISAYLTEALTIKVVAGATGVATTAQKAWNVAIAANPIGALIIAVAALAVGIYYLTKKTDEQTASEKKLQLTKAATLEISKKAAEASAEQLTTLMSLQNTLSAQTTTTEEYKLALVKLDKELGTNLSTEKDINKAVQEGLILIPQKIKLIELEAKAVASKQMWTETLKEGMVLQAEMDDLMKSSDWSENKRFELNKKREANWAKETVYRNLNISLTDEANKANVEFTKQLTEMGVIELKNNATKKATYSALQQQISALELINAKIGDSANFTYKYNAALITWLDTQDQLNKAKASGAITLQEYNDKLAIGKQTYDTLKTSTDAAYEAGVDFEGMTTDVSEMLSEDFIPSVEGAELATVSFWDALTDEEKRKAVLDGLNEIGGMAQQLGDIFSQAYTNAQIKSDNYYGLEYEKIDKAREQKTISEEQYNKKKAELDKKRQEAEREIKIKAAKAEKEGAIFSATINLAKGITSALSTVPPASFAFAAIVALLDAAQLAAIVAAPIPKYATGGLVPGAGDKDNQPGMMMPGEYVVKKSAVQKNFNAIDSINNDNGDSLAKSIAFHLGNTIQSIPVINVASDTIATNSRLRKVRNASYIA